MHLVRNLQNCIALIRYVSLDSKIIVKNPYNSQFYHIIFK